MPFHILTILHNAKPNYTRHCTDLHIINSALQKKTLVKLSRTRFSRQITQAKTPLTSYSINISALSLSPYTTHSAVSDIFPQRSMQYKPLGWRVTFCAICLWQGYVKFACNAVVRGLGGGGGERFGAVLFSDSVYNIKHSHTSITSVAISCSLWWNKLHVVNWKFH